MSGPRLGSLSNNSWSGGSKNKIKTQQKIHLETKISDTQTELVHHVRVPEPPSSNSSSELTNLDETTPDCRGGGRPFHQCDWLFFFVLFFILSFISFIWRCNLRPNVRHNENFAHFTGFPFCQMCFLFVYFNKDKLDNIYLSSSINKNQIITLYRSERKETAKNSTKKWFRTSYPCFKFITLSYRLSFYKINISFVSYKRGRRKNTERRGTESICIQKLFKTSYPGSNFITPFLAGATRYSPLKLSSHRTAQPAKKKSCVHAGPLSETIINHPIIKLAFFAQLIHRFPYPALSVVYPQRAAATPARGAPSTAASQQQPLTKGSSIRSAKTRSPPSPKRKPSSLEPSVSRLVSLSS